MIRPYGNKITANVHKSVCIISAQSAVNMDFAVMLTGFVFSNFRQYHKFSFFIAKLKVVLNLCFR